MSDGPLQFETFPGSLNGDVPDNDSDLVRPEQALLLPWGVNPRGTWLDYRIWIEYELDPGMALHKILPQSSPTPDTLASISAAAPNAETAMNLGVNLNSNSRATDYVQRMATSTYTFILKGWGVRAGYQVPVPGLVSVGGQPAVPDLHWSSGNVMLSNFAGIPIWMCSWALRYFVAAPPQPSSGAPTLRVPEPVLANPALHIRSNNPLPLAIVLPATQTDQRAVQQSSLISQ